VRRVRDRRDAARQFRQRLDLDLLDQIADDLVKQRDVLCVEGRSAFKKKIGDAAKGFSPFFCRAVLDHLFQFRKQRGADTHYKTLRKRPRN